MSAKGVPTNLWCLLQIILQQRRSNSCMNPNQAKQREILWILIITLWILIINQFSFLPLHSGLFYLFSQLLFFLDKINSRSEWSDKVSLLLIGVKCRLKFCYSWMTGSESSILFTGLFSYKTHSFDLIFESWTSCDRLDKLLNCANWLLLSSQLTLAIAKGPSFIWISIIWRYTP